MRTRISLPSAIRTHVRPFSLVAPAFILLTTAVVLHAQTPNPLAYLTFDEGFGTIAHDSSGNGNDASLLGGAGWTTGLVGPFALNLSGAVGSYADIPRDVVDTTKSFTALGRSNPIGAGKGDCGAAPLGRSNRGKFTK